MIYTVYGIRLKGDREVRYIGFTAGELASRLKKHLQSQIFEASYRPLIPWLKEHRDGVEIFAISKCATEAEARGTEQALIALCLRLNQRLLNGAHVPPKFRVAATC